VWLAIAEARALGLAWHGPVGGLCSACPQLGRHAFTRVHDNRRVNVSKLEYLAVYGRASMAAFRQLSTHIVPSRSNVREARLNTYGQKFHPESLYEPI